MEHDIQAIDDHVHDVENAQKWYRFEDIKFGPKSVAPLKALIGAGGGRWEKRISEANQDVADKLKSNKARTEYALHNLSLKTQNPDENTSANRVAIDKTRCLKQVSLAGPVFDVQADFDDWISGQKNVYVYNKPLPAPDNARKIFEKTSTGQILLPDQADPPEDWVLSKQDVFRLKKHADFIKWVTEWRVELETEGRGDEEDDRKNSGNSPSTPSTGGASATKTESERPTPT